jgi:hypothetical protein
MPMALGCSAFAVKIRWLLNAERACADLIEFRAVLDETSQRLDALEVKVQLEMVAWETRLRDVSVSPSRL